MNVEELMKILMTLHPNTLVMVKGANPVKPVLVTGVEKGINTVKLVIPDQEKEKFVAHPEWDMILPRIK